MLAPQPGIFALGTRSHYFLELDLKPRVAAAELAGALARLQEPRRTTAGANVVVGFAPSLLAAVSPDDVPEGARDFTEVRGPDGYRMPGTQHSAWVWASGAGYDTVFDLARAAAAAASPAASLADHVGGFAYRDSRDLTGFVDGTENPPLDLAPEVAIVADGAPGAGSSVALVQRWAHDLGSFHRLALAEQEEVIGRTKAESEELGPERMRQSSHVSRMVVTGDDGQELKVFRRSVSYGDLLVHGMVFIAFSNRPDVPARMLERMAGGEGGPRDRLTYFSSPKRGAYYVVPPVQVLRRLA